MAWFLVLLVLAVVAFVLGFAVAAKWLFVLAAVALVIGLVVWAAGALPRR